MTILGTQTNTSQVPKGSVLTLGSFDGVHLGHKQIFEAMKSRAKEQGLSTTVVTFDPHPRQIIYPKAQDLELLTTLEEKKKLIEDIGIDHFYIQNFTVEFSQLPAQQFIEKFIVGVFQPSLIIMGYDHRFGLNRQGDFALLKEASKSYNFEVQEIDQYLIDENKISSTVIRRSLKEGKPEVAEKLLGRPYHFSGEVIHGDKMGGKLGYKTANVQPSDSHKLIPMPGIYAVLVTYNDLVFGGMMYIGNKPTFRDDDKRFIEVHIFDFNEILYGKEIDVTLLKFIREGKTFDSKEDLALRLDQDKKIALDVLKRHNTENAGFQYS